MPPRRRKKKAAAPVPAFTDSDSFADSDDDFSDVGALCTDPFGGGGIRRRGAAVPGTAAPGADQGD